MEESEDHRSPWENSGALQLLAEMLSFGQESCVTSPQSTLADLPLVGSRNQGVHAPRTPAA